MDSHADVVELCTLLQCLGFTMKSLDASDGNISQEAGVTTVVINCQSSGLHVVLESSSLSCTCPINDMQTSGFWQVSGIAGGKQSEKECGSTVLGSIPKVYRERLSQELGEMVRCIRELNESDIERPKETEGLNKSASMVELGSPENRHFQLKVDTPTRYRSLDTLTSDKDEPKSLPTPGALQKHVTDHSIDGEKADDKVKKGISRMCRRQSTYTVSTGPDSVRRRNKTSSPIKACPLTLLESLIEAERTANDLHEKLSSVIREYMDDDNNNNSSISSMALDVSKISVLKAEASKAQFASSPNLSATASIREELSKSKLKRFDSSSTSNLAKPLPSKDEKNSKFSRISPNFFKFRKDIGVKDEKDAKGSRLSNLFKNKAVTPVRIPPHSPTPGQSLSGSKKKFSHVKSTIPRPTSKKD